MHRTILAVPMLRVAVHCDAAIGTMHADQMRLRQALLNLMSNANG